MARAYQESHMLESLSSSTKTLQTQVAELAKLSGLHDERIQKLTTANTELAAKNAALETRIAAKYIIHLPIPLPFSLPPLPPTLPLLTSYSYPPSEYNTTARLSNLHTSLSPSASTIHKPLTPLHDLSTNRPIRHFPKHERDIRTMSPAEVIQVLQALGVQTLGMGMADRKARLREEVGLSREPEKNVGS